MVGQCSGHHLQEILGIDVNVIREAEVAADVLEGDGGEEGRQTAEFALDLNREDGLGERGGYRGLGQLVLKAHVVVAGKRGRPDGLSLQPKRKSCKNRKGMGGMGRPLTWES